MISIKVWDNTPIETSSDKIKDEVAKSIVNYVIEHWDECVQSTTEKFDNKYETQFFITL